MSWFDQKKNEISETELIAYHLHELPPRRERAVARALEASAALTAKSTAIAATLQAVKDTPKSIDQAAFTRVWSALQPHLKPYALPLKAKPRWQTPVFAKAALASLAALGVGVVATRLHRPSVKIPTPALPSAVGPATPASNALHDTYSLPFVASTGTFHDRLSGGLRHSGPKQAEGPTVSILSPYPPPSTPQTATSEPSRQKPDEPTAPLLTPPAQPETFAKTTDQLAAAANTGKTKPHTPKLRSASHETDVMLALGGTLIAAHTSLVTNTEQNTQTATNAIAAISAFHQQFRPALGYRVTLSYTRPDFENTSVPYNGSGFYSGGHINSQIYEAAATYVIQGPHHNRWSTSADAGGALMAFLPTDNLSISHAFRPAGVLAATLDYTIGKHWAARATYRLQIFRGPNLHYTDGLVPVTPSILVGNEPSVGIVYRFGNSEPHPPKP